jgi:hypothetical protein
MLVKGQLSTKHTMHCHVSASIYMIQALDIVCHGPSRGTLRICTMTPFTVSCWQVLGVLVRALLPEGLALVRKQLKETVPSSQHALVASCFNLMDALLRPYVGPGASKWLQPRTNQSCRSDYVKAKALHMSSLI